MSGHRHQKTHGGRIKFRLSGTTLSVGGIAAELGFPSLYSNCFRRTTGQSPMEYRGASRK